MRMLTVLLTAILGHCPILFAAPSYPEAVVPETVEVKQIKIWSDGRALDGTLYRPKNLHDNDKVPAIVTSHGWGGDKKTASRYATKFAASGLIALTFTHSTWGKSQGNVLLKEIQGAEKTGESKTQVHVVRHIIDPIDWSQNVRSAIDYLEGEPNVDKSKIGGWGTSFGAGIMAFNAASDYRISSLFLQVAAFPSLSGEQLRHAQRRAIDIARGNIMAIPENVDSMPGLEGTPHLARFLQYHPMESVAHLNIPTFFLAAGDENLFKNEEHSEKAFNTLKNKGNVVTEYRVLPGINHYGIYLDGYETGSALALDWFKKTLN